MGFTRRGKLARPELVYLNGKRREDLEGESRLRSGADPRRGVLFTSTALRIQSARERPPGGLDSPGAGSWPGQSLCTSTASGGKIWKGNPGSGQNTGSGSKSLQSNRIGYRGSLLAPAGVLPTSMALRPRARGNGPRAGWIHPAREAGPARACVPQRQAAGRSGRGIPGAARIPGAVQNLYKVTESVTGVLCWPRRVSCLPQWR